MSTAILVSGSIAFDIIFSIPVDFRKAIPLKNGKIRSFNATYTAHERNEFPGGTAGNISFWLGQENVGCSVFSAWGKDFSEKGYRKKLEALGVKFHGYEGKFTGHAYMVSDPLHQQLIIWQPNAYEHINTLKLNDCFLKEELRNFEFAIFSAGTPLSICAHIKEFRKYNTTATVIFDPGQITSVFSKTEFQKCCAISDILIGNDIEFQICKRFGIPKHVVQIETLGKRGILLREPGHTEHRLPAKKVEKVMETTGAGDAFRAGLIAGLAEGKSLKEASQKGIILGAKCVTLPSAQF
jgi:adenosine kinase